MKSKNIWGLVCSVIICEVAGAIGAIFVMPNISGWYSTLVKSSLNPPAFVFGPVWTLLYFLMGIAVFIIWNKGKERKDVRHAVKVFSFQLLLNILWSILFFGLQNPLLALVDIVLLWLAIVWTIIAFYKISKGAAWILAPYLLWVSFALYLNLTVCRLN